jgi:release factor glutamine methyltransferase
MAQVQDIISNATIELKKKNIQSARLDAEILLSTVLKSNRLDLVLKKNQNINLEEEQLFNHFLDKRKNNEPVAYIIKNKSFWNEDYYITSGALIPRPETEILIEMICKKIINGKKSLNILDIGCGSGCLLISLLREFSKSRGLGLDISKEALHICKTNINKYNLNYRAKLIHGDMNKITIVNKFDIIVSNPPYLKNSEYQKLSKDIKQYEPRIALVANQEDGIYYYRKIIKKFSSALKVGGLLAFEIGDKQWKEIKRELVNNSFKIIDKYKLINDQIRCVLALKL